MKQAIAQAQSGGKSGVYADLLDSVYGLVFFGTPHRGGDHTSLGDIAAKIAGSITNSKKNSLMEALKKNSFFAEAVKENFRNRLNDFLILTFYESRKLKGTVVRPTSVSIRSMK